MQEKDSGFVQDRRRRRKRVGRIKKAILAFAAGWIVLSMLLILGLLMKVLSLEKRLDYFLKDFDAIEDTQWVEGSDALEENAEQEWKQASTESVRVDIDAENLAEQGDVHKIYLTFDDGPSQNTREILDILAEYGIKATFFVTGKEGEVAEELYKRIVEEGHTLGMRSYSNSYNVIYQSKEAFEEDYRKLKDYLYELTGEECRYYRFPGGSSNQISNVPMNELIRFLNREKIVYFDWNVSSGDAASIAYTADEIVENITEDVVKYKTSVVLLHDSSEKSTTVKALGPLIEALQAMNAEILPIDENTRVIQYVKADSVE
ncbi:MAG: polysaccharide deacetylase family protein [Roseburia sp.]